VAKETLRGVLSGHFGGIRYYRFGVFAGIGFDVGFVVVRSVGDNQASHDVLLLFMLLNVLKCCYFYCYAELDVTATTSSVASFVNDGFEK